MTNNTKSIKQKLFYSSMIIAFMWVIVGDLVSFHLELIYGNKNSNWHQPFAKTHKDDSKTYKVKTHKDVASSKAKYLFLANSESFEINLASTDFHYFDASIHFLHSPNVGTIFLRGPPSLA